MIPTLVDGDIVAARADAIVNAYNRNIIPWWLLVPQGVSGAIKKRAGFGPFRELTGRGAIPLGGAVLTGAGRLPYKGIIHVAGTSMWWRSSEASIRASARSALRLADEHGFRSVAMPLIGAGTGGGDEDEVQAFLEDEIRASKYTGHVVLVRFERP